LANWTVWLALIVAMRSGASAKLSVAAQIVVTQIAVRVEATL
jgi:hypothetical protein